MLFTTVFVYFKNVAFARAIVNDPDVILLNEAMKDADLLIPIDHSKLSNLVNIDPYFLDLPFDPQNEYSIPYFWGTVGIAYNSTLLEGQTFESWGDLWDPTLKQEVVLVDSAREVIRMGLNLLGYSLNPTNMDELEQTAANLNELNPNVKAVIGDEIIQLMVNKEAAVALTWSGQAADMMADNEDINYVIPDEEAQEHLEVYRNLGLDKLGTYSKLFLKFKMDSKYFRTDFDLQSKSEILLFFPLLW